MPVRTYLDSTVVPVLRQVCLPEASQLRFMCNTIRRVYFLRNLETRSASRSDIFSQTQRVNSQTQRVNSQASMLWRDAHT
eukprot:5209778-Pyramimonas_sp.AAC.1